NQWLEHRDDGRVTLRYRLDLAEPLDLSSSVATLQIFDPTIYVAFFIDREKPAELSIPDNGCAIDFETEDDRGIDASTNFTDDFLASMDALDEFASAFAETITLKCA
ncbi:MAG: DUF1007 family protein, partial [Pseudomonadota bacterium]